MENNQFVINLDEIITLAAKTGADTALTTIKKERQKRLKEKYDRRLRNTRLLLREYRACKVHAAEAVYKTELRPIDILDEIDDDFISGELCLDSIKTSAERTRVIVEHINTMLEVLRVLCEKSGRPEQMRRYNVLWDMYISDDVTNIEDIAEKYNIDRRTAYRDIESIIPDLTVLLFGVDGLRT